MKDIHASCSTSKVAGWRHASDVPRWSLPLIIVLLLTAILPLHLAAQGNDGLNELLCRPGATSMSLSVMFEKAVEVYAEYGTSPGAYASVTPKQTAGAGVPVLIVFDALEPDTRYYYRTAWTRSGASTYSFGPERQFHTKRSPGSTFSFTLEADPHPYDKKGSHRLWSIALQNQLRDSPDFLIDLGDTFGDDHNPTTITEAEIRQLHLDCRPFFGLACHSVPFLFCMGNHEGESGYYLLQSVPDNLAIWGTRWRKYYFPNPVPDRFTTGNTAIEPFGVGAPENYYAMEWGDALIIVLDAYRYYTTSAKPRKWDWTIGREQYEWFKRTLETSKAKFTFVINHHTLGEARGGATTAMLYEWGGTEGDGKPSTFATNRPGWEMPIHQLMVKHGVSIYFQGHDHLYAREVVDGIVYQEIPMPSDSTQVIGTLDNGDAYTDLKIDASGHLRVTVAPGGATVDYVRAWLPEHETGGHRNGEVAHSYTVQPRVTGVEEHGLPVSLELVQNHPNPFTAVTRMAWSLPAGGPAVVRVLDMLGREVTTLADGFAGAGSHSTVFNAGTLPPGMYICQLLFRGQSVTRTMQLMR